MLIQVDYTFLCKSSLVKYKNNINPLNAQLNPICHLLALLGSHHILHVSRIIMVRTTSPEKPS